MNECRSRTLLALVVACCSCVRTGYTGGAPVEGDGDAGETEPRLDSSVVDASHRSDSGAKDGGGAPVDGGHHHHVDASDAEGTRPDARADGSAHDATMDTGTDSGGRDAAPEATTHDSGGEKDARLDVSVGCTSSAECPANMACNTTTGVCTTQCSPAQPCNSCCSASGTCIAGPAGTSQCATLSAGLMVVPVCEEPTLTCAQCTGANVCGNGDYGTQINTSYSCAAAGSLGGGTPCAFGCDGMNGKCKDFVPANGAGAAANLHVNDTFTCTGTQNTGLPTLTTGTGDAIKIDTSNLGTFTYVKSGGSSQTILVLWGGVTMSASGTPFIVAHLRSLSLVGTSVTITGPNALVLLVDDDVSITGTTATPGSINLAGLFTAAGPGQSKNGVGVSGTLGAGGGGGGHGVVGGTGGTGLGTTMVVLGGMGGSVDGSAFLLTAGSPGGGSAADVVGKGGGALQISACGDISIGANVLVNASGGGGSAGTSTATGGNGGGSGGMIILEGATTKMLAGTIVANGGSGGQGGNVAAPGPGGGLDWTTSLAFNEPAPGGDVAGALGGAGGAGGAGTTSPTSGNPAAASAGIGAGGGGGGGAYGAISIGVSPIMTKVSADVASPTPYYSHTCTTTNGAPPANCTY